MLADSDPASPPEFEGEVVGLIAKGAFVQFGEQGFEGFLPARRMRDWWTLNELGTALEAEGSGSRLRLGDSVRVTVDGVEQPAVGSIWCRRGALLVHERQIRA